MKIPPLKIGQAVQVDWNDVKAAMGWSYNQAVQRKPGNIRSLGYVVQMNEECLTLTTSLSETGASIDDLSIPLGCIKVVEVLKEWDRNPEVV